LPTFSGRVALYILSLHLKKISSSSVALIPDYVCNVVHRAFTMAGWDIAEYRTNEIFEAEWQDIMTAIRKYNAGVLVGSSVFGSSALLKFLADPSKQSQLRTLGIQVVVDIAQDISLIDHIPPNCSDFLHAVISFNDKSFPGSMGGGILSKSIRGYFSHSLSIFEKIRLYRWFLLKSFSMIQKKYYASGNRYDFSTCDIFPYEIKSIRPVKLQLILGIIGMYSLPYYQSKKKALLRHNLHLRTVYAETAAYLVYRDRSLVPQTAMRRHIKPPYATDYNRNLSLRPSDLIVHNKGFFDCS
jgi:hypothetical protein